VECIDNPLDRAADPKIGQPITHIRYYDSNMTGF